jgi:YVTN family beta-propeller protein
MGALIGGVCLALACFGLALSAEAKTYAYIFHDATGQVSVIDTDVHEVIVTVDVGLRVRWFASRFFDGKRVWAVDGDPDKAEVVVFDPWTLRTLQRVPFGKGPSFSVELSPDHQFAITAAAGSNEVVVIDTASYEIVRRIPKGQFPCDLILSSDGRLAYEPDRDQDTLSIIDWQAGTTLHTISLATGSKPHMLTLSPDGRRLWVQEREAFKLSVFDTQTRERVAHLPVGIRPATNEFSPSGQYTLVTHIGDSVVKVFETATFREVKTLQVGESPVNSAFHPDGRYAYVTNRQSGTVSVIATDRWEVVKTLTVGGSPFGIYLFDPTQGQMAGNR